MLFERACDCRAKCGNAHPPSRQGHEFRAGGDYAPPGSHSKNLLPGPEDPVKLDMKLFPASVRPRSDPRMQLVSSAEGVHSWLIVLDQHPSLDDVRYFSSLRSNFGLPLTLLWHDDESFECDIPLTEPPTTARKVMPPRFDRPLKTSQVGLGAQVPICSKDEMDIATAATVRKCQKLISTFLHADRGQRPRHRKMVAPGRLRLAPHW
jgi:hypothetical protein